MDTERTSSAVLERSAAEALRDKLGAEDPDEVRYALGLLEGQRTQSWHPALRALLRTRPSTCASGRWPARGRRRQRDWPRRRDAPSRSRPRLRTEALLYLSRERGIDPLAQIESLGTSPILDPRRHGRISGLPARLRTSTPPARFSSRCRTRRAAGAGSGPRRPGSSPRARGVHVHAAGAARRSGRRGRPPGHPDRERDGAGGDRGRAHRLSRRPEVSDEAAGAFWRASEPIVPEVRGASGRQCPPRGQAELPAVSFGSAPSRPSRSSSAACSRLIRPSATASSRPQQASDAAP